MSTTIESLELEIVENSKSATSGIDALTSSLTKLKGATKGKLGLSAVVKELEVFNSADVKGVKDKIVTLSAALDTLTKLPKSNLSSYISPLKALPKALEGLNSVDAKSLLSKLEGLAMALAPLSNMGTSNLGSFITPLKQLPQVFAELNKLDMAAFTAKIQALATAMKPLADEMNKVALGFSAMPGKIQKLLKETEKIPKKNKLAANSFTDLYHKMTLAWRGLQMIGKVGKKAVTESMEYTENFNLFSVSLGEYASEAKEYAESLEKSLGIDASEWMRNQGIFMTLGKGFGVASDKAYLMSENLTQLGYDLSSFFNISTEESMQKLQSGLAGELEPLRRLGFDLSQAKLEATALELGIDKAVSSMTQAEKAQLRYYAIMTQVTDTHGDFAKTLESPANQFKILKAQIDVTARNIGNIFIPIISKVLPHLIAITKAVGILAGKIATLVGYEKPELPEIEPMEETASGTSEALEDAVDNAKKLKNYMMGFDELNVIDPTSGTTDDLGGTFDIDLPEYNFLENYTGSKSEEILNKMREMVRVAKEWMGLTDDLKWDGLVTNIKNNIGKIDDLFAGTSLALGAILAFTGASVPLGIALMAGGAMKFATEAALNSDKLPDDIANVIAIITSAISLAGLALGAVLAFSGTNIPLGIALMAGGALTLGTAIVPNWGKLSDDVKDIITILTTAVGSALLMMGAIFAFSGANIPLGIGMMIAGAGALATAIVPNWDKIVEALRSPLGLIMALVSGAVLVLGALLTFSGTAIPLGIGLMVAGAAGLGTVVAINWDFIKDTVKKVLDNIKTIISGALLVLGVLMLLNPTTIGLGLALIFAGLKGGHEAMKTESNPIVDFVKDMANKIIDVINNALTKINSAFASIGLGSIQFDLIPKYAEGGFPTEGSLFIAQEAGAEMVGSIGRRTAVANNDQIVAGIAGGVASANEEQNALLREQNSLLRAILEKDNSINIDGRRLTDTVEKHQRERGRVLITGGVL